jgi:hypothetical protein
LRLLCLDCGPASNPRCLTALIHRAKVRGHSFASRADNLVEVLLQVSGAKEFDLKNPEENLGARMLRQAAEKTGEMVGDGTTTSTILANAIFADGVRTWWLERRPRRKEFVHRCG